jgi:hypothetical protein
MHHGLGRIVGRGLVAVRRTAALAPAPPAASRCLGRFVSGLGLAVSVRPGVLAGLGPLGVGGGTATAVGCRGLSRLLAGLVSGLLRPATAAPATPATAGVVAVLARLVVIGHYGLGVVTA